MKNTKILQSVVLILILIFSLVLAVGCNITEEPPQEQDDISTKWEKIISSGDSAISKIIMGEHTAKTVSDQLSSITSPDIRPTPAIDNKEDIKFVINSIGSEKISFEEYPKDTEEYNAYIDSKAGLRVISIAIYDINNNEMLQIGIYEDNTIDVRYRETIDGKMSLYKYMSHFEENIFEQLEAFYSSKK